MQIIKVKRVGMLYCDTKEVSQSSSFYIRRVTMKGQPYQVQIVLEQLGWNKTFLALKDGPGNLSGRLPIVQRCSFSLKVVVVSSAAFQRRERDNASSTTIATIVRRSELRLECSNSNVKLCERARG